MPTRSNQNISTRARARVNAARARTTLAFDVYGTLVDVSAAVDALARRLDGDRAKAEAVSARWREKQLEYSFRRTLMGLAADFGRCTREALALALAENDAALGPESRAGLLAEYGRLPLFPDARPALRALSSRADVRLLAFSNGAAEAVRGALAANNALDFFADIVSAAEAGKFKPAREVYAHFLKRAKSRAEDSWLVSGNPFDILGAQNAGMKAAWIRRGAARFDPWEDFSPPVTLRSLRDLESALTSPAAPGESSPAGPTPARIRPR